MFQRAKKLVFGALAGVFPMIALSSGAWSVEVPAERLSLLNSEDFQKREKAQADLAAWARRQPDSAMDALYRLSRDAEDPEVRERCLAVLRGLVNDEYLKEGEGYIGIRMMDEKVVVPGDPKPRGAVRVVQVVPDSAADLAGLRVDDRIVGLNRMLWREMDATLPFSEAVRQFKPRSKITLKLLRNAEVVDLEVTLGRRPLLADNPFLDSRTADLEAAERASMDAHFRRWLDQRKSRD